VTDPAAKRGRIASFDDNTRDASAHDLHPANQTGCRSLGPVTHAHGPFVRHFRGPYAAFQFAGLPPLKHPRIDQNEGAIAEYKYGSTMNTREANPRIHCNRRALDTIFMGFFPHPA
jgi:hypothetical protein